MRYKVVYGEPDKGFIDGVNDLMDKGWRPLGGIAVCPIPDSFPNVFQAMVLDEEEKGE